MGSSAEKIPAPSAEVIPFRVPRPESQAVSVDIKEHAVFVVTGTDKKVHFVTPTYAEISGGGEAPYDRPFASVEEAQAFLNEGGYTYLHIRGVQDSATTHDPASGSIESEAQAMSETHAEIVKLVERCGTKADEMKALVARAESFSLKGHAGKVERIQKRIQGLSLEFNNVLAQAIALSDEDDTELVQLAEQQLHIDGALLAKKRERRNQMNDVVIHMETLTAQAVSEMSALDAMRTTLATNPGERTTKVPKILVKDANAPTVAQGEEQQTGGPEGPKGPEFGLVMAELKTKVEDIINAITTPKEYGEFRAKMVKRKSHGGHERHLFFHIDDIKEKVGRKITADELDQVKVAEDWLESVMHRKFGVIKKDGLKVQFETEVARIASVQDESGLEALAQAWSAGISSEVWQSEWMSLTDWDRRNITTEYEALKPDLLDRLKARRREIRFEPWMDRLGVGALEKLALLEDAIRDGYQIYRRQIDKAVGGKISDKECQKLWEQKGGEKILENAVMRYLSEFSGMNPDEGRELFRVIIGVLRQD